MENIRKVERRNNTKWEKIVFTELRKNDIFRLFESDGNIVIDDHTSVFTALSDSYINENGVGAIKI